MFFVASAVHKLAPNKGLDREGKAGSVKLGGIKGRHCGTTIVEIEEGIW
jgi:hypothetical protein